MFPRSCGRLLETNLTTASTAQEGRHAAEVIQAAYESSRTGKAVYLPL